ncbi:DNA polymerase III subunit beta [bacterium]|nr:DNA polymerase III subunit beta [bacterium]
MIKRSFKREVITKALDRCFISIEKKNTMPILNHILFKTTETECTMIATNLDSSVVISVPFEEGEGEGTYVFPAKYVFDICKLARGEVVEFNFEEQQQVLNIKSGRSRYTIPCSDPSNFPTIETFDDSKGISVHISRILNVLKKLQFSMTDNNINKSYGGILLNRDAQSDDIELVTTDSHRLSIISLKNFDFNVEGIEEGLVISGKNFNEIKRIFADIKEVYMSVNDGKLLIKSDKIVFISRLMKNEFPNYREVLGSSKKESDENKCVIDKKELIEGVKRVIALSTDEKIWATQFDFRGDVLIMNAHSEFGGNSEDEILLEKPFGKDLSIGINARYLLDVLGIIDDEKVTVVVEEGLKPLTIIKNSEEYDYVHLIMPLRI